MVNKLLAEDLYERFHQVNTCNMAPADAARERERTSLICFGNPYRLAEPERKKVLQNPTVALRLVLGNNYNTADETDATNRAVAQKIIDALKKVKA